MSSYQILLDKISHRSAHNSSYLNSRLFFCFRPKCEDFDNRSRNTSSIRIYTNAIVTKKVTANA